MTISELKQEVLARIETADEPMLLHLYSILSADDPEVVNWWDELDGDIQRSNNENVSNQDVVNGSPKWL